MILTKIRRITRAGFVNFWRNGFLSLSSVVVLTLSLLVIGGLMFFSTLSQSFLASLKDRVDVNVYFTLSAPESQILEVKKELESLPEVSSVEYISRDASIEAFRTRHADNSLILQGLDEIGYNPLPAVLTIKAKDPSQYEVIAKFLASRQTNVSQSIIDDADFGRNKEIIDRLARIIPLIEKTGTIASIILVIIAIVITFNTVRIIIFSSKDEIAVMKLVGASNAFVRGPFVVSGIMYGVVAAIIALFVLALSVFYIDTLFIRFLNAPAEIMAIKHILFGYYVGHFPVLFMTLILSGIALGGISSYMAVKRYLNV